MGKSSSWSNYYDVYYYVTAKFGGIFQLHQSGEDGYRTCG